MPSHCYCKFCKGPESDDLFKYHCLCCFCIQRKNSYEKAKLRYLYGEICCKCYNFTGSKKFLCKECFKRKHRELHGVKVFKV